MPPSMSYLSDVIVYWMSCAGSTHDDQLRASSGKLEEALEKGPLVSEGMGTIV